MVMILYEFYSIDFFFVTYLHSKNNKKDVLFILLAFCISHVESNLD